VIIAFYIKNLQVILQIEVLLLLKELLSLLSLQIDFLFTIDDQILFIFGKKIVEIQATEILLIL